MNIIPDSILLRIQVVNEKMNACIGTLDQGTLRLVAETFDNLRLREHMSPVEKVALSALASRISGSPLLKGSLEATPINEKVIGVVNRFFGDKFTLGGVSDPRFETFLNRSKRLEDLLSKHSENRVGLLLATESFLKDGMDENDAGYILRAVVEISDSERESVFSAAAPLIKEGMNGHDVTTILSATANIAREERESFSRLVASLINEQMGGNETTTILSGLAKIPRQERESFCRLVAPLIKEGTDRYVIAVILTAIAKIQHSERESFCRLVAPLIKEGMDGYEANFVLEKLAGVHTQDRDLFLSCAEKTANYRNERIAESLKNLILDNGSSEVYMASIRHLTSPKMFSENTLVTHKILPSIVLAKWIAEAATESTDQEKPILELISFLNNSKDDFRNNLSPLTQTFLLAALSLDGATGISPLKKLQLLSIVSKSSEHLKGFRFICSLLGRNSIEKLNSLPLKSPIEELTRAFEESLVEDSFINLSRIENLVDKYVGFFGQTREPLALEVYITGARFSGSTRVRMTLERFVRSVLEGTFENERYDTTHNPHLKRIQKYDEQTGSTVLDRWKRLTFEMLVNPILETTEERAFSFESFLKEKLGDGHGIKNEIEQLPNLLSFLSANKQEKRIILDATIENNKNTSEKIKTSLSIAEKKELAPILKMIQAEQLCMKLILEPELSQEREVQKIQAISAGLGSLELGHDLKELAKILNAPQISLSEGLEKVALCKDWEDLFLSGTEVTGSCQRIDGNPKLNKCLLAYCLDGKNAMIAVKDASGRLLARCMLRLLWDKTDSKPVLFLDRLYPTPCPKERESAIKMAAKECARQMDLELFAIGEEGFPSAKTIESRGSSCPYEYADGAEGVMLNGIFSVRNPRKIEL